MLGQELFPKPFVAVNFDSMVPAKENVAKGCSEYKQSCCVAFYFIFFDFIEGYRSCHENDRLVFWSIYSARRA